MRVPEETSAHVGIFPFPLDIKLEGEGQEHPKESIEPILILLGVPKRGNIYFSLSTKRTITLNTSHF